MKTNREKYKPILQEKQEGEKKMPEKRMWLQDLRKKKHWTQKQAAKMCGVSYHVYAAIETGEKLGKLEARTKIANALHFDANWFEMEEVPYVIEPETQEDKGLVHTKRPKKKAKIGVSPEDVSPERFQAMQKRYSGVLKRFRPILTVTASGEITGNYWENIARFNDNRQNTLTTHFMR